MSSSVSPQAQAAQVSLVRTFQWIVIFVSICAELDLNILSL